MEFHQPVLLNEVVDRLKVAPGMVVSDGTLGSGGHAAEFLKLLGGDGVLVGLDRDPLMLAKAKARLEAINFSGVRLVLECARYDELPEVLSREGLAGTDAVLLDLGINSLQVEEADRGFSFTKEGPLDARFNPDEPGTVPVSELVNTASEHDLKQWLRDYADEKLAKQIARRIVDARKTKPFTTTRELADLVTSVYPPKMRYGSIHPATRTFQALRIVANRELEMVERGIRACIESLNPGGTLCVISYHSGEDRITKSLFDEYGSARPSPENRYAATTWEGVNYRVESRGAVKPSEEEIASNPRARSARLRTLRRLEEAA